MTENRENDRVEAEVVVTKFFDYLAQKQYEDAFNCFNPEIWQLKKNEQFKTYIKNTNEKFGKIIDRKLDLWATRVVVGYIPDSYYKMFYIVKYASIETKVSIILRKVNGTIMIESYQSDPDKFL